jgi:hypothetical protein
MPCKVIPFPTVVSAVRRQAPIVARHHVRLEVGQSCYDVDVMAFVTALMPCQVEGKRSAVVMAAGVGTEQPGAMRVRVLGWSRSAGQSCRAVVRLEGRKEEWERYWEQLGIASGSPGLTAEQRGQKSLATGPRKRDESSCATSAQKEVHMTNAENSAAVPQEAATAAATKHARPARPADRAKAAAQKRKQPKSAPRTGRPKARSKAVTKTAKRPPVSKKPRPQSKAARILELIGRAKGATLPEMMQATAWQAHSIRGFLSTAVKKHQLKISSSRNEVGQRVYALER